MTKRRFRKWRGKKATLLNEAEVPLSPGQPGETQSDSSEEKTEVSDKKTEEAIMRKGDDESNHIALSSEFEERRNPTNEMSHRIGERHQQQPQNSNVGSSNTISPWDIRAAGSSTVRDEDRDDMDTASGRSDPTDPSFSGRVQFVGMPSRSGKRRFFVPRSQAASVHSGDAVASESGLSQQMKNSRRENTGAVVASTNANVEVEENNGHSGLLCFQDAFRCITPGRRNNQQKPESKERTSSRRRNRKAGGKSAYSLMDGDSSSSQQSDPKMHKSQGMASASQSSQDSEDDDMVPVEPAQLSLIDVAPGLQLVQALTDDPQVEVTEESSSMALEKMEADIGQAQAELQRYRQEKMDVQRELRETIKVAKQHGKMKVGYQLATNELRAELKESKEALMDAREAQESAQQLQQELESSKVEVRTLQDMNRVLTDQAQRHKQQNEAMVQNYMDSNQELRSRLESLPEIQEEAEELRANREELSRQLLKLRQDANRQQSTQDMGSLSQDATIEKLKKENEDLATEICSLQIRENELKSTEINNLDNGPTEASPRRNTELEGSINQRSDILQELSSTAAASQQGMDAAGKVDPVILEEIQSLQREIHSTEIALVEQQKQIDLLKQDMPQHEEIQPQPQDRLEAILPVVVEPKRRSGVFFRRRGSTRESSSSFPEKKLQFLRSKKRSKADNARAEVERVASMQHQNTSSQRRSTNAQKLAELEFALQKSQARSKELENQLSKVQQASTREIRTSSMTARQRRLSQDRLVVSVLYPRKSKLVTADKLNSLIYTTNSTSNPGRLGVYGQLLAV